MSSVSIIIPAYNAERFIGETVQSVIAQTHEQWELIVVNDGSTDGTLKLTRLLAETDKRISVINKTNGGVSTARNVGYDAAQFKFLAFLDADDLWDSNMLEACLEEFQSDNNPGLVYANLQIIDENSNSTGEAKSGKEGQLLNDLLFWQGHTISPPSGVLIKREVLDAIGSFDPQLSNNADQDFYIRAAAKYSIGRVSQSLLKYRVHQYNMHGNIQVMEQDTIRVFKKAKTAGLFETVKFEKICFANMYSILAFSFGKQERNVRKFIYYLWKAFSRSPKRTVTIILSKLI